MRVLAAIAILCVLQVALAISVNPEPGVTVMQPTKTGDATKGETILTPTGAPPTSPCCCQQKVDGCNSACQTNQCPAAAAAATTPAPVQLGNVNVSKLVVVPAATSGSVCCCQQNIQGCVSACPQACPQMVVPEIKEKQLCLCALVNGQCPAVCPVTVQPEIQEKCGCCGLAACSCCPGTLTTNVGCGCVGKPVCSCATVKPEYTDESGKVRPTFINKFDNCNCCGSIGCGCCNK